ncbi:MAG: Rqc2 family fibronectin-binding protein [Pyrinomonadaceae bacterium]
MHQQTIEEIVGELGSLLNGRFTGKIFQLSSFSVAIDFGLRSAGYLFISAEPSSPRLYLIKRQGRELERQSIQASPFVQALRSKLRGSSLISITKDKSERIARLLFLDNEIERRHATLVVQLTGRSANLLLLDEDGKIVNALRPPRGAGQQIGQRYEPPPGQTKIAGEEEPVRKGDFATLSAAADEYYSRREAAEKFSSQAKALLDSLSKQLTATARLEKNLEKDLEAHGDPEQHKRLGDLLLANLGNAKREGNTVRLKDYYSDGTPEIQTEVDQNVSLQDAAAQSFARYTKAKRAREEIGNLLAQLAQTKTQLEKRKAELENIIASGDQTSLDLITGTDERVSVKKRRKKSEKIPGVRRYRSSDGYEILVGGAARTNDQLTFRVARPNDLWLHAADYPGPHVVVRTQTRNEVPQRTIIEAAQLAAKFSQAGNDSKVAVHYTPRKFLSKPKGAAPGLVRISTFRTMLVEPAENVPRIHD